MAENIPQTATAAAAATPLPVATPNTGPDQATTARGVPYYEKLRRELRETLQRKRILDRNLATLEESIYRFEHSYLEETGAGNIIKGFDNYIKGSTGSSLSTAGSLGASFGGGASGGTSTRRKGQVSDMDRVFSRSSASFMRDSPAPSSAHTTPSHAATPTYSGPSGPNTKDTSAPNSVKGASTSKNKKKAAGGTVSARDREDDDEGGDSKPPVKRLKITYGRGE
ncbi:chromatin modification- protein eaf6 [Ophidiomyces ophidiicola]|uniref:Chromatin modification- protein eaf6 n=1 Tax=Ophidiomyces ophidiicola TaxID=1387563 RepID=A0ACB8V0L5_9EURO|nr:chromatin modification- protein eaf6 [Ophidiomyces ophidiicola]KAI1968790.1 chromatin modification- protein eaf6 [Ophidiomyces ophidiicola]KAI2010903.1 chromatin modification- protein eaf6 [Ophidiomyces ophidiicola]KAI2028149.1 chromatin modification- protein eaf6 [Ophidiomyces ophidiicola]KAI2041219.1 chromatin modification- protein eaf6 [Ophidiomyces ophidiicola]